MTIVLCCLSLSTFSILSSRWQRPLTAVLLGDPLGGKCAERAAGLSVGCHGAAHLGLTVVVAAVHVTRLVERVRVQQAVAGLEETFQICELQTVVFSLELWYCCIITGLSQGHILRLITTTVKSQAMEDRKWVATKRWQGETDEMSDKYIPVLHAVGFPALSELQCTDGRFSTRGDVIISGVPIEVPTQSTHLVLQPWAHCNAESVESVITHLDVLRSVDHQESLWCRYSCH